MLTTRMKLTAPFIRFALACCGRGLSRGVVLLLLVAANVAAQGRLPSLCYDVARDSSSSVASHEVAEHQVAPILARLRGVLPSRPEEFTSPSIWSLRGRIDSIAAQDSAALLQALSWLVVDNRTTTTFTAVVAAQYFVAYGGDNDQLLAAYTEAGEPPDRLTWVFLGLRPPLSPRSERRVFEYGCLAAWAIAQLNRDTFLMMVDGQGRSPISRVTLDDVLADVVRLTSGQVREQAKQLREFVRRESGARDY